MANKRDVVTVTLSASAGLGGSFTVAYPTGRTAEDYFGGTDHQIFTTSYRSLFAKDGDFSIAFGASLMTVTILTALAMVVGTKVTLNIDRAERNVGLGEIQELANDAKMALLTPVKITLGAPLTASSVAVCASQAVLAATVAGAVINGAQAAAGKVVLATPRNVVAAWTGTSVLTVTGTDEYGVAMRESSASGTTFTGKKAFKEITKIVVSADVTGLTAGTGVVLGLPMFLPDLVDITREILDGVAATAGTG